MIQYHFPGKVVLVTGSSRGIGAACVKALQGEFDVSSTSTATVDIQKPEDVKRAFDEAEKKYGRKVDCVVANAGIEGAVAPIVDYPLEEFERVLAVNVRGVWLGLQCVVPVMRRRGGGSIVITSSGAGTGKRVSHQAAV